ncbi:MAG: sigma-54-dependent Fis family transcriptional regulator [Candidatus Latescibacteria bacterium]|nr:sigma-54-dependent Fis family transcriptional regulator [Candidatus Latescibacterota bacterium]
MAKILIIDDDVSFCKMFTKKIEIMNHDVYVENTLNAGMKTAVSQNFDIVFLDVRMPDGNGLDMLPRLRQLKSEPEIIIITGLGDPDGAELAIKSGAWDYIQKGTSLQEIILPLVRALQYSEEKRSSKTLVSLKRVGIIGNSEQLRMCLDQVAQAAQSDANVFISGETGTGKERFAQVIHENSNRVNENFVTVDCTALPETIVESVLFGHKKGSFTGADKDHVGLIKHADKGTLFLDEIGDLTLSLQKTFLRVLEEHHFRPVGSSQEDSSNFRLITATNRNLDDMVNNMEFRKDLLFRLRSFVIELPPLRDRIEDIKDITMYHTAKICDRYGIETKGFSPEFFSVLENYNWPGNVRELVNVLERTISAARYEGTLFPRHLPISLRVIIARDSVTQEKQIQYKGSKNIDTSDGFPKLKDYRDAAIDDVEKRYLEDLLAYTGYNKKVACRISGLSRTRLYTLLKKYDL